MAVLEVTPAEAQELARLVRARHMELERMLRNVEETEGLDATKYRVRKELTAAVETIQDLLVKVEDAAKAKA